MASSKRSPALPDVPTFAENGIAFEGDSWLAIMGPPGIPADVAAKLNQEIAATLREPETQERLAKIGLVVVASPQSGLTEVLQRDVPEVGQGGQGLRRRRRVSYTTPPPYASFAAHVARGKDERFGDGRQTE